MLSRLKCCSLALSLALLLLTKSGVALAITNDDIVDATSPASIYMRNGFELQNGSIRELVSHKTGDSLHYCNPVSVRSKPDVDSKKVTSINDGNFEDYIIKKGPNHGWANVFKSEKFIGYSAQAIKDGELVNNIICPASSWITQSNLELEGAEFTAELIDQRELTIKGSDGAVLYTRKVSRKTSLYELQDSNGLFGWIVGWDLYDDSPYFSDIDFTVVRVIVPYVDSDGDQQVWDSVYGGVQNSKYLDIIQQGKGRVTIVAGMAIWGPKFYQCTACTWHWGQPVFVNIERTSSGVRESIDNGSLDFINVPDLPAPDRFLYNWVYWNPARLMDLLQGEVGDQIKYITSKCSPNKLALYKSSFLPQWEWTSSLHYVLDERSGNGVAVKDQGKNTLTVKAYESYSNGAETSYKALLDYIWDSSEFSSSDASGKWGGSKIMANGSEYLYDLRECVGDNQNDKDLIDNIVGYLNMPLDIDLLEAVIGERQ